jgi:O-antigen ligase
LIDKSLVATLVVLCLLIWLPVLFVQIEKRGFFVLLVWLLTAPIATNIVGHPTSNPFFAPPVLPAGIQLQEIFDPTRLLFNAFMIVVLLRFAIKRAVSIAWDWTETWMVFFAVVALSNVLLKSDQLAFGLHVVADAFVTPFAAYYLTRRFVQSESEFGQLMKVMGYVGSYLIIIALIEQFAVSSVSIYRLRGPFETRDLLYIVVMAAFFTVSLGSIRGRADAKRMRAVTRSVRPFVIAGAPLVVLLTWTRGNWIGFLSGTLLVVVLGHRMIGFQWKTFAIGLAALLIGAVVPLVGNVVLSKALEQRITDTRNIYERLGAWDGALQVGVENPIFGIGLNNLQGVLERRRTVVDGVKNLTHHHNCYLGFFAELGVVGLLPYLLIASSIIHTGCTIYRTGRRYQDRWRGIAIIAIMTAYLVPAFFSTILYNTAVSHIYVFACVGAIAGLYGSTGKCRMLRKANLRRPDRFCRQLPASRHSQQPAAFV